MGNYLLSGLNWGAAVGGGLGYLLGGPVGAVIGGTIGFLTIGQWQRKTKS